MEGVSVNSCTSLLLESRTVPLIMGILNVTPDSFSDGGSFLEPSQAVERALSMVEEGADILDVGGESTRPGADPVPLKVELQRVIPVVEALSSKVRVPISVDTRKPEVAEAAVEAGASVLNDVEGFRSPQMVEVAARTGVFTVVMHMKGTPRNMQRNPHYNNVIEEVSAFLEQQRDVLVRAGVLRERIIVDPGIGFGKRFEDNITLIRSLNILKNRLGQPVLLGHSRKSFIGEILNLPPAERDEGTMAVGVFAALKGVDILRVHNVKMCKRALQVLEALKEESLSGE